MLQGPRLRFERDSRFRCRVLAVFGILGACGLLFLIPFGLQFFRHYARSSNGEKPSLSDRAAPAEKFVLLAESHDEVLMPQLVLLQRPAVEVFPDYITITFRRCRSHEPWRKLVDPGRYVFETDFVVPPGGNMSDPAVAAAAAAAAAAEQPDFPPPAFNASEYLDPRNVYRDLLDCSLLTYADRQFRRIKFSASAEPFFLSASRLEYFNRYFLPLVKGGPIEYVEKKVSQETADKYSFQRFFSAKEQRKAETVAAAGGSGDLPRENGLFDLPLSPSFPHLRGLKGAEKERKGGEAAVDARPPVPSQVLDGFMTRHNTADRLRTAILLDEFGRLAGALNLVWYSLYGQSIGSFRHSDNIPWDDDLDIGISLSECIAMTGALQSVSHDKEMQQYYASWLLKHGLEASNVLESAPYNDDAAYRLMESWRVASVPQMARRWWYDEGQRTVPAHVKAEVIPRAFHYLDIAYHSFPHINIATFKLFLRDSARTRFPWHWPFLDGFAMVRDELNTVMRGIGNFPEVRPAELTYPLFMRPQGPLVAAPFAPDAIDIFAHYRRRDGEMKEGDADSGALGNCWTGGWSHRIEEGWVMPQARAPCRLLHPVFPFVRRRGYISVPAAAVPLSALYTAPAVVRENNSTVVGLNRYAKRVFSQFYGITDVDTYFLIDKNAKQPWKPFWQDLLMSFRIRDSAAVYEFLNSSLPLAGHAKELVVNTRHAFDELRKSLGLDPITGNGLPLLGGAEELVGLAPEEEVGEEEQEEEDPAAEEKAAAENEKAAAEKEKPAEEKPAAEKPAKDKPAEEKPAEEKPAVKEESKPAPAETPVEEKPAQKAAAAPEPAPAPEAAPAPETKAEDKPAEKSKSAEEAKPAEEVKPAVEEPSAEENKPAESSAAEVKAAKEETVKEEQAAEKPVEEKPAEEKPAEEKPAEEKPAEEKAAAEKPAEEQEPAAAVVSAADAKPAEAESDAEAKKAAEEKSGGDSAEPSKSAVPPKPETPPEQAPESKVAPPPEVPAEAPAEGPPAAPGPVAEAAAAAAASVEPAAVVDASAPGEKAQEKSEADEKAAGGEGEAGKTRRLSVWGDLDFMAAAADASAAEAAGLASGPPIPAWQRDMFGWYSHGSREVDNVFRAYPRLQEQDMLTLFTSRQLAAETAALVDRFVVCALHRSWAELPEYFGRTAAGVALQSDPRFAPDACGGGAERELYFEDTYIGEAIVARRIFFHADGLEEKIGLPVES